MKKNTIRIASRKSPLAIKQAEIIAEKLLAKHSNLFIEIIGMSTEGDRKLSMPLATVGGKGLFVKELEQALLENRADIAVHSMKDVPVEFPSGLILHTICERDDPRDVFVSKLYENFFTMPAGTIIGTASLRRQCIIKTLRPDLQVKFLRGNIQTRLRKLEEGKFDAIILAAAGLKRIALTHHIKHHFHPETFIPAVGQGVLGIECRSEDYTTQSLLRPLQHETTAICLKAERSLNYHLQGGCQVPIAAHGIIIEKTLVLRALVGHPNGTILLKASGSSAIEDAEQLGKSVSDNLLKHGAREILNETYIQYG